MSYQFNFFLREEEIPKSALTLKIKSEAVLKKQFLHEIGRAIEAPPYYGENWDALDEIMRSLDWLDEYYSIELRHYTTPGIGPESLRIYVSILADAVDWWRKRAEHSLTVSFPAASRRQILAALEQWRS